MKKYLIGFLIFLFTICLKPQNKNTVTAALENFFSNSFFESTLAALDVYDLTAKEVVYQRNNKFLMHPASNMKILTTAAGLFFLGPDYYFETILFYKGDIEGSVLNGDIYIVGGFDPEFSVYDLDYFVKAIDSLGIREINGNLYADVSRKDTLYWGRGWMWDDDPSTDAPFMSSLNINMNSVDVFLLGAEEGEKAQVILNPHTEYFEIFNETVTIPSTEHNSFYVTRDWVNKINHIIAVGKVNKRSELSRDEKPVTLTVTRPDLFFLTLFKETLQRKGIKVNGTVSNFWLPYDAIYISTFSRPFSEVIRRVNKVSSNLHAEMVFYAMGEKYFGKPATSEKGAKIINNLISMSGMNPGKYRLVDGSGLSHYNLVSAELLLAVLKHMYYKEPDLYRVLIDSFPISGIDGTLRRRMAESVAFSNVKAKTGTLSGVSALSGYLESKSGNLLAFSVLMENFVGSASTARAFQDEICRILTEY